MQTKRFSRNKENFKCENCGQEVKGTGYTNHCPECFYSKHVDINPGDRLEQCQGLMEPIRVEVEHGEQILVQRCVKCQKEMKNKLSGEDNLEKLRELIEDLAKK